MENTWPLLVSDLIGGPTAEGAIIDFVFGRVAGNALGTVGEKLLGGKCGKVSRRIEPPSAIEDVAQCYRVLHIFWPSTPKYTMGRLTK